MAGDVDGHSGPRRRSAGIPLSDGHLAVEVDNMHQGPPATGCPHLRLGVGQYLLSQVEISSLDRGNRVVYVDAQHVPFPRVVLVPRADRLSMLARQLEIAVVG